MTLTSYDWVKKIEGALEEMKAIPLWGYPPSFPWEKFNQALAKNLEVSDFQVQYTGTEKKTAEHALAGLGENPSILAFTLAPLETPFYWALPQDDAAALSSYALHPHLKAKGFSDPRLQTGFYQFLCLETVQIINQLRAFEDLNIKMHSFKSFLEKEAVCIDISIKLNQRTLRGRLIIPTELHQAFKLHFAEKKPSLLSKDIAKKTDVTLSLEAGNVTLTLGQWKQIQCGDFIILDRCSFDPKSHKGIVTIALEKTPLLKAKIKENKIKILDYALYLEENTDIDMKNPEDEENHEEDTDFSSEPEESYQKEESSEEENQQNEDSALWSAKENSSDSMEKMISTHEIPITINVEVARLRMNLEKLLELQPGNVLELDVIPDMGVDLTINGKKVARGELVKLGEILGVKILNLGGM